MAEQLPTMEVEEIPVFVVRLPPGFVSGCGTTGSRFGLVDEDGQICLLSKEWAHWA